MRGDHHLRPFTIYGLYESDGDEFMGWALYYPRYEKTFYYDPQTRETHLANTPAQVYTVLTRIADVRMHWLDNPESR